MKRLVAILAALAYLCAAQAASAGFLVNSHLSTLAAGPNLQFQQCAFKSGGALTTTYTLTSQNTGAEAPDRYTIIGIAAQDTATNFSVTSVSVSGASATLVEHSDTTSVNVLTSIWILANDTGTSETLEATVSEAVDNGLVFCVWRVTGLGSATATDSDSDEDAASNPMTVSLDVHAGGFVVGLCKTRDKASTYSWTGLTFRDDANTTSVSASAADEDDLAADSTYDVECDPTTTFNSAMSAAAFR